MQRLKDSAEMLFEPTGDLWKDYSAYCEIDDKAERDDIVDAIHVVELKPPTAAADEAAGGAASPNATQAASPTLATSSSSKVQTHVIARNLEYCLAKKDAMPLANAIPHCHSMTKLHLTGCGITEHSLKLFVEAAYKSPSLTSVAVDFNPGGLYKDPTVGRKDKNEVIVNPSTYRGQNQRVVIDEPADKKAGKGAADKSKDKKGAAAVTQDDAAEKQPFPLPTGWHALLLTGIQQLSLRGNHITDRQVEPLCALLESNTELVSLSLWGNHITSTGAHSLARALRGNRRLTALNVGHNQIDDAGAVALAEALLTSDVSNDDASKLRVRTLRGVATASELPVLPTYGDLFGAPPAVEDKKDKKKDAGKKGKSDGPAERHKGEFDRDCVRLDESHVRVPGNTSLWALNMTNNSRITAQGVAKVVAVLARQEPAFDSGALFDGNVPDHYCVPSLAIERLELAHSALPTDAVESLATKLQEFAQYRASAASRAQSA